MENSTIKNFAEKYKNGTQHFLVLANSLTSEQLSLVDANGWTPRHVIHHMADSEAQSYARIRRLLAEPGSLIQGYDESLWAENQKLGYATREVAPSLLVIQAVRSSSYELISRFSEGDLLLYGTHSESGKYTVLNWLENYSAHPFDHAKQITKMISSSKK